MYLLDNMSYEEPDYQGIKLFVCILKSQKHQNKIMRVLHTNQYEMCTWRKTKNYLT